MFTLIKRAISAIPTPSAGKVTVFVDSASGQPYMKDEAGTSTTLVGTAGAAGAAGATGPTGPDGTDSGIFWMGGSQGPQGERGAVGATGATGAAGAGSDETLLWMESKQQAAGSSASVLLAAVPYKPTVATVTTTSATFADVDATNLVIAFVAPASGRVLIRVTARAIAGNNSEIAWNLRSGSSDVSSSDAIVLYNSATSSVEARVAHSVILSGLTPGVLTTWKLGHARASGTGTVGTKYGGTSGQALLEAWSA